MSFPRHQEIYPPMEAQTITVGAPAHRLDEFPTGYSLAGCAPAEPAAASPAENQCAVQSSCRSRIFQRTANSVLTVCVSPGGKRKRGLASQECSRSVRVKNIYGESFEIRMGDDSSSIFFKGALRLSGADDYVPILAMLKETLISPVAPIVLDLRELDFLNSSGITMFSRFVIEARDHIGIELQFIVSEAVPWQVRSLKNLQRLMPSLNICLT
jgi:hypothetical protein